MVIENTQSMKNDDNIVMVLYGKGGVGKTTFVASAPKPLLIDFENGSKYLGQRGFNIDTIRMSAWFSETEKKELQNVIKKYETIIIDPLGEAFDKIVESEVLNNKKFKQYDGSLTMAGWGEAKKMMKNLIKFLRDSRKNVVIVAHVSEIQDENNLYHRIQVQTKLKDEIPTMVDIISYLAVVKEKELDVRYLYTPAQGNNFDSKDRTGRMPEKVKISEKNGWNDMVKSMKPVSTKPHTDSEPTTQKDVHSEPVTEQVKAVAQEPVIVGKPVISGINETLVTWIDSGICDKQSVLDFTELLIEKKQNDNSKEFVLKFYKNLEEGNEDVSFLVDGILSTSLFPTTQKQNYVKALTPYKLPDANKDKFYNALGAFVNKVKGEA
jgi:phage nucleotide-binding protein